MGITCGLEIPPQISLDGVETDDESVIRPSQADAVYSYAVKFGLARRSNFREDV